MTELERRAELRAGGLPPAIVDEIIASESAGGVWCDGTIVIDARGRRCVSRELAARVDRARAADPRPAPAAPSSPSFGVVVAGVTVAVVVLALVLERR